MRHIFVNPLAYAVFPTLYYHSLTSPIKAKYTGFLLATDILGNLLRFEHTNTIDLSGLRGLFDIDLYTPRGAVKLGRWDASDITQNILFNVWYRSTRVIWTADPNTFLPEDAWVLLSTDEEYVDYYAVGYNYIVYQVLVDGQLDDNKKVTVTVEMDPEDYSGNFSEGRPVEGQPANTRSFGFVLNNTHQENWLKFTLKFEGYSESYVVRYEYNSYQEIEIRTKEYEEHNFTGNMKDVFEVEGTDQTIDINALYSLTTFVDDGLYADIRDYTLDVDTPVIGNEWIKITGTSPGGELSDGTPDPATGIVYHVTIEANTDTTPRSGTITFSVTYKGYSGTKTITINQAGGTWISPYTPGWSMEFGYITSGTAAKKITNGIEVYSTGPDTSSDTATFFNYNEAIKEGETYYQATIQVTGMKEGYTIVGVRGWESVTITEDGEYILPEYTWDNSQGLPEGSDIYNDYKPALKFAVGTESNVVWDEPITIVITSVESNER